MGNDDGKDDENGKKIKDLKIPGSEMTASCCHCCYPYCHLMVWLNTA